MSPASSVLRLTLVSNKFEHEYNSAALTEIKTTHGRAYITFSALAHNSIVVRSARYYLIFLGRSSYGKWEDVWIASRPHELRRLRTKIGVQVPAALIQLCEWSERNLVSTIETTVTAKTRQHDGHS
ncbi:hypothetical protein FOZG_02187 [Fusarium oxysporum Fo47]|uniref:Uncharacterized protein n=1 Tax=Fusarium oxysporum Fo47 TaxID=660027 RepID=W9LDK6_FUSOX|nr:hypothetical protein FOZG_02187 [Fusarium oxysporum Fo47]